MKTPSNLSEAEILQTVNEHFEIGAATLEFLPIGESAWIYVATDVEGQKTIIKAQEQLDLASSEVLELLRQQNYSWMPHLMTSADGRVWEKVGSLYFSAQQYIGSVSLNHAGSEPRDTYLHTLGVMLKDLHTVQFKADELPHVKQEQFDSPLVELAHKAVEAITSHTGSNPAVQAVQQCFETQKDKLDQLFINIKRYGDELFRQPHNFRLTHGDVHFGNIIEPPDGHLYLVDWDETSIALPEMDLKYFSNEQLTVISQGYGQDLLENRLAIQYYRNLQMIRALWFWPNKLLEAPDQEQDSLAKATVDIFSSSPFLLRALTKL